MVAPTIQAGNRTGLIYVDLPPNERLRPGMFARGEIEISRAMAFTVPLQSVVSADGYSYVFVLKHDNTVERRRVETGGVHDSEIEVVERPRGGRHGGRQGRRLLEGRRPRRRELGGRLMNFVTWSIRNPVPVIILFIGLTIAGLISFPKLGVQDRPDIEFPAVIVTITYPGVAPTQMESEITRKVEDAVATISGIEQMTSTVDEGASTTSIEFAFGTDLSRALDDVRDAVTRIRSDLPPDANEPIVSRTTTAGGSLVTWSVASDTMSDTELSWFVDLVVSRELSSVKAWAESRESAEWIARSASTSTPTAWRRSGRPRATCPASCAGSRPSTRAARRASAASSKRCARPASSRRFTTSPACRSPCPTAAACGSTRSPTCATRRASSARSRS